MLSFSCDSSVPQLLTTAGPAGIMLLLQKDYSCSQRNFVRKKGCHPHKHSVFLKLDCFPEGKPTAGALLFEMSDLLEIPRDKADLRLTGHTESSTGGIHTDTDVHGKNLLYTVLEDVYSRL